MRATLSAAVVLFGTTLFGCASAGFKQVSFASDVAPEARTLSRPTVHVVKNVQMTDTVLEARLRTKLEEFLLAKGFVITNPDTADIYVLATFGSGERMVPSTAAVFREADIKTERNRDGTVVRRTISPDHMEYLRLPQVEESVWLQVLYSDAKYYRETGLIRNLWRGETAMKGKESTLNEFAPYLLVPVLKYFGRGTEEVLTVDVKNRDAVRF